MAASDTSETFYTEGSYLELNPTWHVEDSAWKAAQVAALIDHHQLSLESICDVGCGAGEVLSQLARAIDPPTTFTGYDISPQAIQLASSREQSRLRFVLGDITSQATETFSLLLAMDVIEHVEDPFGFLRSLKGHAELAIFHIPLDINVQAVARNLLLSTCWQPFGHLHYFEKETALATLAHSGYEVLDWVYTPSSFAQPPKGRREQTIQAARRMLYKASPDVAQRLLGGWSLLVLAR